VLRWFSPRVQDKSYRYSTITGVACSGDGRHIAANYLNDHVYLFAVEGDEGREPPAQPLPTAQGIPAKDSPARGKRRACRDSSTEPASRASFPFPQKLLWMCADSNSSTRLSRAVVRSE
jgi:hypothetical protein